MKRIVCQFLLMLLAALHVSAQTPLEAFSAKANALLQAEFGFGITNIPVYSTTNPAVGYDAAIHFQLQSAADLYDAGTPATNFPSVFRPLFSWQSNTLYIVGYSCVTTDFYNQISQGLKNINDPTITTNDNVWGIPWVVGTKGQIPAFNEYCYANEVNVERLLEFVRFPSGKPGQYLTSPPQSTNQLYIFSISNFFGAEIWNFYPSTFTNSITILISNEISMEFTNNYDFGTNMIFNGGTSSIIQGWAGNSFKIPISQNLIPLPPSYWSESTRQLLPLTNGFGFPSSDLHQTGWPVHDWTVTITNNLMYALVDNNTGRLLDFVNLGAFGSSIDLNSALSNSYPFGSSGPEFWITTPAIDIPNSPMSQGVLNQILYGESVSSEFAYSLIGIAPPYGYPSSIGYFIAPSTNPSNPEEQGGWANFIQSCSWHAGCPIVHYTVEDLTDPRYNEATLSTSLLQTLMPLQSCMAFPVCTLGEINPDYNPGSISNMIPDLSDGSFQMNFSGATDLPYLVWASTNLADWSLAGTAAQTTPGNFQFTDVNASNYPTRFYDVQLP